MYNENEKAIIWLTLFEKLSLPKAKVLLSLYYEPKEILQNLEKDEVAITKIVGKEIYAKMLESDEKLLNSYIENLTKQGIVCLTIASPNFPAKFMGIKESPIMIFAKGNLDLLNQKSVAIVGTRNPSAYGREVAEKYATALAKSGLVVVSGLASGVDKIAHENTLKANGKTIAVLGGGFDCIFPAMNTNLAKDVANQGLLISEYRPNLFATKYTFPFRNRLISALSEAVFVAEAGEKSGALYTSSYALQQGKVVFCVPSNINNVRAVGTNLLLKNHEAILTLSPSDILAHCGVSDGAEKTTKKELPPQTNMTENIILEALQDKTQSFDELQILTKLEPKNLNSCLTLMQIRGLIKKLPGNEFSV